MKTIIVKTYTNDNLNIKMLGYMAFTFVMFSLYVTPIHVTLGDVVEPAQAQVVETVYKIATVEKGNNGLPSQTQKDSTEWACNQEWNTRKDILQDQSDKLSKNLFLDTCYYDLLGIAFRESSFDCSTIGWSNQEVGCFQYLPSNLSDKFTQEQALDYRQAALKTIDRMVVSFDYPANRTLAITRHNGAGQAAANYAKKVKESSDYFREIGL